MAWQITRPYILEARNVHVALPKALDMLLAESTHEGSRNGDVFVMQHPVTTVYSRPWERVIFWEERDANPFFHFMEGLGFLGGIKEVVFYAQYAQQLKVYSDDGETLPASYGHRWRHYFDRDQLAWAIERLRADPRDRRVVIGMWDPNEDPARADAGSKDVPCNTQIYLNVHGTRLDMLVTCRSNDIFWGAYGANAVHMSMLHEYLARGIGVRQGYYHQLSFNWHAYEAFYKKVMNDRVAREPEQGLRTAIVSATNAECIWNPYASDFRGGDLVAMMSDYTHDRRADYAGWDRQLGIFLTGGSTVEDGLTDPFFTGVAVPIRDAHAAYQEKNYDKARELVEQCRALDWRRGCREWLERRTRQCSRVAEGAAQSSVHAAG